jgi:hypothetical protein
VSAPCINLKQRIGRELIYGLVFLNGPYYSSTDKERRKRIEYPMCERSFCEVKDILIMGNRNGVEMVEMGSDMTNFLFFASDPA